MGEAGREIFDEATSIFDDLLDDLKAKDLLRKGTDHESRMKLSRIWENSRNHGIALNETMKLFDEVKKEEILSKLQQLGLSEIGITYSFVSQLWGSLIISLESVLKTSLVFFLKEEQGLRRDMTLGQLLYGISEISPDVGKRLASIIDRKFRNTIAHGSFWFEKGGKVFLSEDSYLDKVKEISLHEFWISIKEQNIVSIAFVDVLMQKVRAGFFR